MLKPFWWALGFRISATRMPKWIENAALGTKTLAFTTINNIKSSSWQNKEETGEHSVEITLPQ